MTVKTAISLRRPLPDQIDAAAEDLGMSRSGFLAPAAEKLVRSLENRKLLAKINGAYADGSDAEEHETQQGMWDLQRRQLREEEW